MIRYFYSVYDKLGKTYNDPFLLVNDDVAKRGFFDECQKSDSMLNKFPTDYALFRIGEFDFATGTIKTYEPVVVCRATDFVRSE